MLGMQNRTFNPHLAAGTQVVSGRPYKPGDQPILTLCEVDVYGGASGLTLSGFNVSSTDGLISPNPGNGGATGASSGNGQSFVAGVPVGGVVIGANSVAGGVDNAVAMVGVPDRFVCLSVSNAVRLSIRPSAHPYDCRSFQVDLCRSIRSSTRHFH
jgi:hypothetical protein